MANDPSDTRDLVERLRGGDRRALALREYLAQLGMDPARIHTVTYGASKPVDPGHNESAWKKNRRGDFVLLQPQ